MRQVLKSRDLVVHSYKEIKGFVNVVGIKSQGANESPKAATEYLANIIDALEEITKTTCGKLTRVIVLGLRSSARAVTT